MKKAGNNISLVYQKASQAPIMRVLNSIMAEEDKISSSPHPRDMEYTEDKIENIRKVCMKHIDIIFDDIVEMGLIDTNSEFYRASKKHIFNTCFQSIYPLMEFSGRLEDNSDFFLFSSYLFSFASFLDEAVDSQKVSSRRVRSYQISSYLLLRYFDWLRSNYTIETILYFYKYYKIQTDYLVLEKKWDMPQLYLSSYGTEEDIYKKAILLFFPIEMFLKEIDFNYSRIFKKLFINYFSYILLADDILDVDFDIENRCLTYPIVLHYKLVNKLPQNSKDISIIMTEVTKNLNNFLTNIKRCYTKLNCQSLIINYKLNEIKNKLVL